MFIIPHPPTSTYIYMPHEDGLPKPIPAEKSDEDGRYHLLGEYGDLQLAPPPPLSKTA
jgi:hypothetical protein